MGRTQRLLVPHRRPKKGHKPLPRTLVCRAQRLRQKHRLHFNPLSRKNSRHPPSDKIKLVLRPPSRKITAKSETPPRPRLPPSPMRLQHKHHQTRRIRSRNRLRPIRCFLRWRYLFRIRNDRLAFNHSTNVCNDLICISSIVDRYSFFI